MKISAQEIAKPITYLINLTITSGTIPKEWKEAKVTPIYRVAQKKLTCLTRHNVETIKSITLKPCSSLSLMFNLKFDMLGMFFYAVFAKISKFQFQYAFLKSAQIS